MTNTSRLCKLQKGCTRLAAVSDKDNQLLAHGWWFSPCTPTSSTTKTGRHDMAEILLKGALKHKKKSNQNQYSQNSCHFELSQIHFLPGIWKHLPYYLLHDKFLLNVSLTDFSY